MEINIPTPQYSSSGISKNDLHHNPFSQFEAWFNDAIKNDQPEPHAMTLATASSSAIPSARTVYLRKTDNQKFTFYTNYNSNKAQNLNENPNAALLFFWHSLHRQIRIQGTISKSTPEDSDAYFKSRPVDSQIASIASPQSQPVPSRQFLDQLFTTTKEKFSKTAPTRPEHWGGYSLSPTSFEFWLGRPNRFSDRILYTHSDNQWTRQRLAP